VTDINWVLVIDNETDVLGADFEDMASGLNHPVMGVTPSSTTPGTHAAALRRHHLAPVSERGTGADAGG